VKDKKQQQPIVAYASGNGSYVSRAWDKSDIVEAQRQERLERLEYGEKDNGK